MGNEGNIIMAIYGKVKCGLTSHVMFTKTNIVSIIYFTSYIQQNTSLILQKQSK